MGYQPKSYRKFLATSVGAVMAASSILPVAASAASDGTTSFSDVTSEYAPQVNYVASKGIKGHDGIFDVNGTVDRTHAAIFLADVLGLSVPTTVTEAPFKDVPANSLYANYVKAVKDAGVFKGDADGNFGPSQVLTREQMASVIVNAYPQLATDSKTATQVTVGDMASVGTSHQPNVQVLANLGITKLPNGNYNPSGNITRLQFASLLYQVNQYLNASPAVTSVSAVNGKELVINFSQPVDKDTVLTGTALNNVTVTAVDGDAVPVTGLKGSLSADGKTLTITAGTYFKGNYTVAVSDSVTSNGVKLPKYADVITVNDTQAPKFVSATATAKDVTNTINVTFDEPVQATGVIAYVDGVAATVGSGSDSNSLTVQTQDLKAGDSVDLSLLNVKDFAGNLITPNPLKTTVTVVKDTAAPTVSSVTVTGENTVNVTFSKEVTDNAGLENAVSLLDTNGVAVGSFTFNSIKSDGKTVVYTAPNFAFGPNNTYTGNLLIQNTVTDTLGNKMVNKYNTSVTFNKDVTAPVAQSASYSKGKLYVSFSEDVNEVSVGSKAGIKIINNATGAEVPVSGSVGIDTVNTNQFVLTQTLPAGSYEVRIPAQLVTDGSLAHNKNASAILNFTVSPVSSSDTDAPVFTYVGTTTNLNVTSPTVAANTAPPAEEVYTYTVQDASGIDLASVRDLNNYTLNGKALPAGTYITTNYDATDVTAPLNVSINIPATSFDTTKTDSILVVSGVKDTVGNTANPQVANAVKVYDGVAPELSTATISSGDKSVLVVSLSESVTGLDDATDFVLDVDGSPVTVASVTPITSGTDKGKYYVTGTGISDFTTASTVTLELAKDTSGTVVTDSQGNQAVFGDAIKVK